MAEETTKGLIAKKLSNIIDYPSVQDIELNKIIYFKEDSYKDNANYNWLEQRFAKASKNQKGIDRGTPDYIIVKSDSNLIIVIECKKDMKKHSRFDNIDEYIIEGYGTPDNTQSYAIDGALWYAEFLKDSYDVIVVAVSGVSESNSKVTTFVYPKHGNKTDIKIIENGTLLNSLMSISQYEKDIDNILDRNHVTEEEVKKELRSYTLTCANFLRANSIEDNSKAGFVSAIILGLTNKESRLYKDVKAAYDKKENTKAKVMDSDPIGKEAVKLLEDALYGNDYVPGIFDVDHIPEGKRKSLRKFYNILLSKDELIKFPKAKNKKTFVDGETVLSACIFSLYEHVVLITEKYHGIDVMGEFYTTFLRFTKGNAKEKGIVLTPNHITNLFCDIAEFYSGKKFDEHTKILDICTGTGGFLISALDRIKSNIEAQYITPQEKMEKYSIAQKDSLIGVEREASMYSLAYANMRFHGDGKSNLFNCSSLMFDSFLSIDESGYVDVGKGTLPLAEALKAYGPIDVGMINPPYSLKDDDKKKKREYPIINEIKDIEENIKKAKKNKDNDKVNNLTQELALKQKELKKDRLDEVVFQNGQSELDFIASMLHYLKEEGIGIAIVPMSCAGNAGKSLRTEILKHHTLLAVMTMPSQLFFDSHVGTATCIMVFKAHVPHDENRSVFFGRWIDDGFTVILHNGRKRTSAYDSIHQEWMDEIDGNANQNKKIWINKKIKITDEALPEAYVDIDYNMLKQSLFEITLKRFALAKYYETRLLETYLNENFDETVFMLDNFNDFYNQYGGVFDSNQATPILDINSWIELPLNKIFKIEDTKGTKTNDMLCGEEIPYMAASKIHNGIKDFYSKDGNEQYISNGNCLVFVSLGDGAAGWTNYIDEDFIGMKGKTKCGYSNNLNVYNGLFIATILSLNKEYYSHGRSWTGDSFEKTKILLPCIKSDKDFVPDWKWMENYIKTLPYSAHLISN